MLATLAVALGASAQVDFRHITFDEAKTAAKAEGKLIFVDFYTQWCGPCKLLAKKVFPTKEIGDYMNPRFISLKLDAEAEGANLAKEIEVTAYPTLAVFDADGNILGRFEGFKEGVQFISAVEACTNPDLSPERVMERYEAGERDAKLVLAYADLMINKTRSYETGPQIIDEYYASLSEDAKKDPENSYLYLQYLYDYNSPRAQYLLSHKDVIPADKKQALDELIDNLYIGQAYKYMTTNEVKGSAETRKAYDAFKKDTAANGMSDKLANMLLIADKRAELDDVAFIAFCDNNFSKLTPDEQGYLVSGMKTLLPLDTEEQKKLATDFMRRHLAELSSPALVSAAYSIYEIDAPKH
ncbi:MAG: thioredoxin family protein [Muribaculaceae bacterium]|nr:thioredoxin family protein [Muribaculaceae bacterium]